MITTVFFIKNPMYDRLKVTKLKTELYKSGNNYVHIFIDKYIQLHVFVEYIN